MPTLAFEIGQKAFWYIRLRLTLLGCFEYADGGTDPRQDLARTGSYGGAEMLTSDDSACTCFM